MSPIVLHVSGPTYAASRNADAFLPILHLFPDVYNIGYIPFLPVVF